MVLLFGGIVALFGANIVGRYLLNAPIVWADEVLVLLMVWCTFIAGGLLVAEREQVVFDLLYERCPPAGRRLLLLAGGALLVAILGAALPAIIDYTLFLWRERTSVLELRLDAAYSCFALFLLAVIARRVALTVRLLRPGWRDTLAAIEPPRA